MKCTLGSPLGTGRRDSAETVPWAWGIPAIIAWRVVPGYFAPAHSCLAWQLYAPCPQTFCGPRDPVSTFHVPHPTLDMQQATRMWLLGAGLCLVGGGGGVRAGS